MIEDKREGLVGASGFQPLTSWIPTKRSENHEYLPREQMASDSWTREECEDSHFNE